MRASVAGGTAVLARSGARFAAQGAVTVPVIAAVFVVIAAFAGGPCGTSRQEADAREVTRTFVPALVAVVRALRRAGAVSRARSMFAALRPVAIAMRTRVLTRFARAGRAVVGTMMVGTSRTVCAVAEVSIA
jgi:hypothetical protein